MIRRDSGFLFAHSLHAFRHFYQGILRHWRELSVDFDEEGFFAAKLNYGIVKVEEIREGDAESGADEVHGIDGRNFIAEGYVGELGFGNA